VTSLDSPPDPAVLRRTRLGLQAVAEHVLSAALHQRNGRIGLRAVPGGVGTPALQASGHEWRRLRLDGTDLVVEVGDESRRAPLTTIRAAADLVGITGGAPSDVYTPATPLDLDAPLELDAHAARYLAAWYACVDDALARLARHAAEDGVTAAEVQLWPEHFDLATSIGECNYGGSPGDDAHDLPYLYVGPWSPPPPGGRYWNETFGASRAADHVSGVDDAMAFFEEGRSQIRSSEPPSNSGRTA
jgi:hypothetical protein